MTTLFRRQALILALLSLFIAPPSVAKGLDAGTANAHVAATIDEILHLIVENRPRDETARILERIIEERTALPQLAQFTAGRYWRAMSGAQRARFTEAFSTYVANVYAGHFRTFEGDVEDLRAFVEIVGAKDAGAKGVVVSSEIRPMQQVAVSVDWLVSDRSGKVAISDLVVEGISLAITQREIVGAMLETHDGDVDRLIEELERQVARGGS